MTTSSARRALVAFLYFVPIPFIAYTSDAYVRSDFVELAPQVSGVVNQVAVANDQKVAVGDLLATLDPESFALSCRPRPEAARRRGRRGEGERGGGPRARKRPGDGEGGRHAGA